LYEPVALSTDTESWTIKCCLISVVMLYIHNVTKVVMNRNRQFGREHKTGYQVTDGLGLSVSLQNTQSYTFSTV